MSSTAHRKTAQQISSFQSPYVSLDVVSYMKSGQIMPFHVFNDSVMPDFLRQLSHGRAHFSRRDAHEDLGGHRGSIRDLFEEIKEDMAHIRNACRRLEHWQSDVNGAVNQLVLQCLDDAFRESMGVASVDASCGDAAARWRKLARIREYVSALKERIYSPLKFPSDKNSVSFKRSQASLTRLRGGGGSDEREISQSWAQLLEVNIAREIAERSSAEIQGVYDGLSNTAKLCLLCFSVFPENAVIKKKVLAHWWIGEGFIGDENGEESDNVTSAGDLFREFIRKGLIEPVYKKQRRSADSCKMKPSVRYAVIGLAEAAGFARFEAGKVRAMASFSMRSTADEEAGSSNGYSSDQGRVRTLFNVSEVRLEFNANFFSKMKYVKVLQLGKWQSSAKHIIEVDDGEFLKGLKRMKHLRYLSLRGVSRITELPSSVCKLWSSRILNLNGCQDLLRLPEGIGSLKKLTHLDMYECYFISHMPKGISQLSELEILKGFVIGKPRPGHEGQSCQLEDLTKLKKLKKLNIHVDRNLETAKREFSCLERFENLESLSVSWSRIYYSSKSPRRMQRVLRQMKSMASFSASPRAGARLVPSPRYETPPNKLPEKLKKLDLHYFPSAKISEWFSLEKIQSLVKMYIRGGDSLSDLSEERGCWRRVEFLRVKFLRELRMDWRELREFFPELIYLEKVQCPGLSFFPCDESGIWKKD